VRGAARWVARPPALVVVTQTVADLVVCARDSGVELRVDSGRRGRLGKLRCRSAGRRQLWLYGYRIQRAVDVITAKIRSQAGAEWSSSVQRVGAVEPVTVRISRRWAAASRGRCSLWLGASLAPKLGQLVDGLNGRR